MLLQAAAEADDDLTADLGAITSLPSDDWDDDSEADGDEAATQPRSPGERPNAPTDGAAGAALPQALHYLPSHSAASTMSPGCCGPAAAASAAVQLAPNSMRLTWRTALASGGAQHVHVYLSSCAAVPVCRQAPNPIPAA